MIYTGDILIILNNFYFILGIYMGGSAFLCLDYKIHWDKPFLSLLDCNISVQQCKELDFVYILMVVSKWNENSVDYQYLWALLESFIYFH